jgi:hypothetical protein
MNATQPDRAGGGLMDETVAYIRRNRPADLSPPGGPPAPPDRGHRVGGQRYTFTGGARPLDGYTIKRAIGRGGFGEVYYSTSDAGKECALKLLTRNIEIERRGVQHCMNLKSPNLIQIFDLKTNDEGDTFVVMEYVAGPSLESILADHPEGLPPHEVRRWLKGLVDGVTYLHDHGIVHRDLKPANLFLEEGVVKIGDYGLSKSIAHSQDAGMSENVGTCYYMAPEIASGKYHKPIDIYAIGIILFEMLTGRVPFDGESTGEVLMKHLSAMPDLRVIDEPYKSILRQALAKDPAHRPPRAVDLLLPEDAPRSPEIRIIGRDDEPLAPAPQALMAAMAPAPAPEPRPAQKEEVLYIGPEENILYIGPDTVPPGSTAGKLRRRIRNLALQAPGRARRATTTAQDRATTRPTTRSSGWFRRTRSTPAPATLTPPPPIAPRQRVADLAGSMLGAAPLAAIAAFVSFPAYEALASPAQAEPLQLAFLFAMALLGSWLVLIPAQARDRSLAGRSMTHRAPFLLTGLMLGGLGLAIVEWTHLGLDSLARGPQPDQWIRTLSVPAYFGTTYALTRWSSLTARGRKSRFRFWPVIKVSAIAGLLAIVTPWIQPWAFLVMVLVAIVVQVASPWRADAAQYEAALAKAGGRTAA